MNHPGLKHRLATIQKLSETIERPVKLMEVCGTHTMSAFRAGLRTTLPETVQLISGPGCPVCVTPIEYVDKAITIAKQPNVIITTFGDMIRVPGSEGSLENCRANGADIRIVYSPSDALALAEKNPEKIIVFLGVGFETTTPGIGWTIKTAFEKGLANYKVLCAHKTMPQAMTALLKDQQINLDGFICPGHVSVIIGADTYRFIATDFNIPSVIVGFEPIDMVMGVEMLLKQLAEKRAEVEIQYSRSVGQKGNAAALDLLDEVFEPCDAIWRGLGVIPGSGLAIREKYYHLDAEKKFRDLDFPVPNEPKGCCCGDVLRGVSSPLDCPLFKTVCTPSQPIGACMVSSEGTCAAYYKYGKNV